VSDSTKQNRLRFIIALVLAAAMAGGFVLLWTARSPEVLPPRELVAVPAADATATHDVESSDLPAEVTPLAALPMPTTAADAALHVIADPPELRVWANTRVRLSVQTDLSFDRYVWHFEDGSEPIAGAIVEHVFAESVRDRHVTVEAMRAGQPTEVATLRLPVERLAVLAADGEERSDAEHLPKPAGTRFLFAGGTIDEAMAARVTSVATDVQAEVLVATGDESSVQALAQAIDNGALTVALLHWPRQQEGEQAALTVVRNPGDTLTQIRRGSRDLGALAVGEVGLAAVDTRGETLDEAELKRLHDVLQWTSAYKTSLLLSARPLTLTRDAELIADRAYRIYEYALRHQVAVVLSASGVFFDGRFGGLRVVGIGEAQAPGCVRPLGQDACQQPSLSVLDVPGQGPPRLHVLVGDGFQTALAKHALPAEVGKIRR
jgi:hypothetical protein